MDQGLLVLARDSIAAIVDRYELGGPAQLVGEARLVRRMLGVMLGGRASGVVQHRELMTLAAQASGLLAYMAVNCGEQKTAGALCREADQFAEEAGALWLRQWVAGTRSLNLYYAKQYVAADAAAAAGIALAPADPRRSG